MLGLQAKNVDPEAIQRIAFCAANRNLLDTEDRKWSILLRSEPSQRRRCEGFFDELWPRSRADNSHIRTSIRSSDQRKSALRGRIETTCQGRGSSPHHAHLRRRHCCIVVLLCCSVFCGCGRQDAKSQMRTQTSEYRIVFVGSADVKRFSRKKHAPR